MTMPSGAARSRGAASTDAAPRAASASGVVTASGIAATMLKVEGNFNVTGPLETFANAGGVHLARALLAEFAGNMARLAAERTARRRNPNGSLLLTRPADAGPSLSPHGGERAGGDGRPVHGAGAAELRGGALLWRAFLGWLQTALFRQRKNRMSDNQVSDILGASFRGRGRRHPVHPDGRRQHVLVGGDGRQRAGVR